MRKLIVVAALLCGAMDAHAEKPNDKWCSKETGQQIVRIKPATWDNGRIVTRDVFAIDGKVITDGPSMDHTEYEDGTDDFVLFYRDHVYEPCN